MSPRPLRFTATALGALVCACGSVSSPASSASPDAGSARPLPTSPPAAPTSTATVAAPATATAGAAPTATASTGTSPTPAGLVEDLTLTAAPGRNLPDGVPATITSATTSGGRCGATAQGGYSAGLAYLAGHPSATLVVTVPSYSGPGTFDASNAEVDLTPPGQGATALSSGPVDTTVTVDATERAGTVAATLASGTVPVLVISGRWRCG